MKAKAPVMVTLILAFAVTLLLFYGRHDLVDRSELGKEGRNLPKGEEPPRSAAI